MYATAAAMYVTCNDRGEMVDATASCPIARDGWRQKMGPPKMDGPPNGCIYPE
jgi:hypothetical protein